jgi:hypothetical protein
VESLVRKNFLSSLEREFGALQRLRTSNSLFIVQDRVRLYVRYSKIHPRGSTFYGLRQEDVAQLEGFPSFIAFLWDGQREPLLIPYEQFSSVFRSTDPSRDGQYKAHVYLGKEGTDLHFVRAGKFGVDSHFGLSKLRAAVLERKTESLPIDFSHRQIQTLVGAIGRYTGHAIYIPLNDRPFLDWNIAERFECVDDVPSTGRHGPTLGLSYIDVLWIHPTRHSLAAVFEVEHSTPIYSGLLRFNDVHIDFKLARAGIVAEADREEAFLRQINRRTFRASGLTEVCLFYSYRDIYDWHQRLGAGRSS